MIWILLTIQLIFIIAEFFITGYFNLISILIVVFNIALAFFRSKSKMLNTIIVVIFLIHLFLFGFIVFKQIIKSNRYVGTRCTEAFNCDCKDGESLCKCDYFADENKTIKQVSCPNQSYNGN